MMYFVLEDNNGV